MLWENMIKTNYEKLPKKIFKVHYIYKISTIVFMIY